MSGGEAISAPPAPGPPPAPVRGTSEGAGQFVDEGRGRVFPCLSCGSDVVFHPGAQRLRCDHCGAEREVIVDEADEVEERDLASELARIAELRRAGRTADTGVDGLDEVRCDSCGATVVFEPQHGSKRCPFCDSPIQREAAHVAADRVPVDGVLPFGIDGAQATSLIDRWIRKLWFAPSAFTKRGAKGTIEGIYLPYWTYDSHTFTRWAGRRGDHYWVTVGSGKNRRRVRRTRWRSVSGSFGRFFDDVLVVAAEGIDRSSSRALEPWPLDDCVPFSRGFLAGHLAQAYEVDLEPGFDIARGRMRSALEGDVRARIGGDVQRITSMDVRHDAVTYKHLLLPVHVFACRWKNRTYQVLVNAVTGEVRGQRPWSWLKIMLAVLAGLAVAIPAGMFIAAEGNF